MNEYILQCRDLSKKFSGRPALNGINRADALSVFSDRTAAERLHL